MRQVDMDAMPLTADPIVDRIIERFMRRSDEGMARFGKTMREAEKPMLEWITDAQEEMMDAILYLEKLKEKCNGESI